MAEGIDQLRGLSVDPKKTFALHNSLRPSHYVALPAACSHCGQGIECIDVVQHCNFNRGNAIKYIWRAGSKSKLTEIQDLEKAAQYIEFEIARLRKEKGEEKVYEQSAS